MYYKVKNATVMVGNRCVDRNWSATVKSKYIHDAYKKLADLYRDQHNMSRYSRVKIIGDIESFE